MKQIIGIYGPAPQSGKTFAATVLCNKGFIRLSFAAPLKQMCVDFLMSLGYSKQNALKYVFTDKEALIPEVGKTVRYLLQTLGTEWGRNCVSNDVWITAFEKTAEKYQKIVIDDIRFENEARVVQKMGGKVWRIICPFASHDFSHESEGSLDDWTGFNHVIENDGTLLDFRKKIDSIVQC
jgi:hypothetical protein